MSLLWLYEPTKSDLCSNKGPAILSRLAGDYEYESLLFMWHD